MGKAFRYRAAATRLFRRSRILPEEDAIAWDRLGNGRSPWCKGREATATSLSLPWRDTCRRAPNILIGHFERARPRAGLEKPPLPACPNRLGLRIRPGNGRSTKCSPPSRASSGQYTPWHLHFRDQTRIARRGPFEFPGYDPLNASSDRTGPDWNAFPAQTLAAARQQSRR